MTIAGSAFSIVKPISTVIIGCGAVVAELYVHPLRRLVQVGAIRIAAGVDPNSERSGRIAATFAGARSYTHASEALSRERPDLTIITSPPAFHAAHAILALQHASHVLCEKPMSIGVSEAERMALAAKAANRLLAVAFPRRFYPNFAEVARILANGELGENLEFIFREGSVYMWPSATEAAFSRPTAGGGALLNTGVHMLDLVLWLFGAPVVLACRDDALIGGVETTAELDLKCPRATGRLQVSWDSALCNGLQIRGSRGDIWVDQADIRKYRHRAAGGAWKEESARIVWAATPHRQRGPQVQPRTYFDCFFLQLVAITRAIRFGEAVPVDAAQATIVQAAIEKAYSLAQALEFPWLPIAERTAMRQHHWRMKK